VLDVSVNSKEAAASSPRHPLMATSASVSSSILQGLAGASVIAQQRLSSALPKTQIARHNTDVIS